MITGHIVTATNIAIDYESAKKNCMRADAEKAIQIFLTGDIGTAFTVFPQALNPLLKALESLCLWKQLVVIPYADTNNKPLYIIIKVGTKAHIDNLGVTEEI